MSIRVLVTGGAGFIGCHVARALLQRGYEVRVLDSLIDQVHTRGAVRDSVLSHVELIRADVRDLDRVSAALDGVDKVVHLAAEVGVGQSMYAIDRYVSVNDHGTAVLFQALIDRPVARIVVASSMSVYGRAFIGQQLASAWTTWCARRSGWPAAGTRSAGGRRAHPDGDAGMEAAESRLGLCADQVCSGAADAHGRAGLWNAGRGAASVQRLWAGPGAVQPLHRRARHFRVAPAEPRAPAGVRGRGAAARLRHVEDIARAFVLALEHPDAPGQVFNIASGRDVSIFEVGAALAGAMVCRI